MHFLNFLSEFVHTHAVFAYSVLFLFVIIEGEFALLISGIATHLSIVETDVLIPVLISGILMKTIIGYFIGSYLRDHYGENKLFHFIERRVLAILPDFNRKPFWSIFISKFIYGVNNFTIIFAGFEKVSQKLYYKAEIISSGIWFSILFFLGFFFSQTAISISHTLTTSLLILFLFIIGFLILQRILNTLFEVAEEIHHGRKY